MFGILLYNLPYWLGEFFGQVKFFFDKNWIGYYFPEFNFSHEIVR